MVLLMSKNPKTTLVSTKKRPVPKSGTNGFSIVFHRVFPRHPSRPHGGTCFFDSFGATTTGSRPWTCLPKKTRKSDEKSGFYGKSDENLGTSLVYGKKNCRKSWFRTPSTWVKTCEVSVWYVSKSGGWSLTPLYPEVVDAYCLYIYIVVCNNIYYYCC